MIKVAAVLLTIVSTTLAQQAQPEAISAVRQIRFELLVARLPEAKAIELQPVLRDPATCGNALETILTLIGKKEAELVDWPILITRTGVLAKTENVQEVRYAVEYAAPDVKVPTEETSTAVVPNPTAPTSDEKKVVKPKEALTVRVLNGLPSAFEKRDAGVSFEVEPSFGVDGVTVEMLVTPQHVTLTGWRKLSVENSHAEKITIEQPDFHTIKTQTNLIVTSGQSALLAFQKLPETPGRIEVFILTTTVLKKDGTPASKPEQTPRKKQR